MAIMGRMAAYTGQQITWEMALNSKEDLSPPGYDWDAHAAGSRSPSRGRPSSPGSRISDRLAT